jgi:hypothetical protein
MKNRIASALVLAVVLAAGISRAAGKDDKPAVRLEHATLVGRDVLLAGTYQIELVAGSDLARFVQDGRTVIATPCKVGLATIAYPGNAVRVKDGAGGPDRLLEIVLSSSKLAIAFPDDRVAATAWESSAR